MKTSHFLYLPYCNKKKNNACAEEESTLYHNFHIAIFGRRWNHRRPIVSDRACDLQIVIKRVFEAYVDKVNIILDGKALPSYSWHQCNRTTINPIHYPLTLLIRWNMKSEHCFKVTRDASTPLLNRVGLDPRIGTLVCVLCSGKQTIEQFSMQPSFPKKPICRICFAAFRSSFYI